MIYIGINARRLVEVENNTFVYEAFRSNGLLTMTINHYSANEGDEHEELDDADDDGYEARGKSTRRGATKSTRTSTSGAIQKS
jgi:hypothetical protein